MQCIMQYGMMPYLTIMQANIANNLCDIANISPIQVLLSSNTVTTERKLIMFSQT